MSDAALRTHDLADPASVWAQLKALGGRLSPRTGLPVAELRPLSEHLLIDIGIDPRDMPRSSMEETDRLHLRERGWRPLSW